MSEEKNQTQTENTIRAWCTSSKCVPQKTRSIASDKIEKKVPRRTVFCPDCNHVLVWKFDKRLRGKLKKENKERGYF